MATLCEDRETFMITYRSVLPRMKNVAYKSRGEKQNTNFMFNNFFYRAFYESVWKNAAKSRKPQMII